MRQRCDLCKIFLIQTSKFENSATGRQYPIRQKLTCSSKNVIYVFSLAVNYYQLLHLFSRSKAPLRETAIFFSYGSCRLGTL